MKINKLTILGSLLILASFTSCSWLNIDPYNQVTEEKEYSKEYGYKNTLTAAYSMLSDPNTYGTELTFGSVDCLANIWQEPSTEGLATYNVMYNHKYDGLYVQNIFNASYTSLYRTIAQLNVLLKNLDERGKKVINSTSTYDLIYAEALSLKTMCQFDILRLWGQIPSDKATKTVSLPYSDAVSYKTPVKLLAYNDYVSRLIADFDKAEKLFKDGNDPCIQKYSFKQLNNYGNSGYSNVKLDDDFFAYRQMRMNYWAVKALKARLYLYIGDKENAYKYAKEVIDAKNEDGSNKFALSTLDDVDKSYYSSPSEALFLLGDKTIRTTSGNLIGGAPEKYDVKSLFLINADDLKEKVFQSKNLTSDIRYKSIWEHKSENFQTGNQIPTLRKYFYDKALDQKINTELITKHQVVPIIRLSELYLMAIETTNDLAEANSLYNKFMRARGVLITEDTFHSLDDVKTFLPNEYLREFYGEGFMFYYYKRTQAAKLLISGLDMTEDSYIIPQPDTQITK